MMNTQCILTDVCASTFSINMCCIALHCITSRLGSSSIINVIKVDSYVCQPAHNNGNREDCQNAIPFIISN